VIPLLIITAFTDSNSSSPSCTNYVCSIMEETTCARKYIDRTELNSAFCPIGQSCDLSRVADWDKNSSPGSILECDDLPYSDSYNRGEYNYSCGDDKKNRELKDGEHPKKCLEDSDCMLQDGTYTECSCGFGHDRYCTPAWDSSVFDGFRNKCEEGWLSYDDLYYWILVKQYYAYTIDTPECAEWLITEFITMNEYKGLTRPVDNGVMLGLNILLVTLLL
jgi:hypothetical protein